MDNNDLISGKRTNYFLGEGGEDTIYKKENYFDKLDILFFHMFDPLLDILTRDQKGSTECTNGTLKWNYTQLTQRTFTNSRTFKEEKK